MSTDHFLELHSYLRRLDEESDKVRDKRWQLLSTAPEERAQRAEDLRKDLARLMGIIPDDGTALNPRTKLVRVKDQYMAYDVLLGVVNGVEAYGQLLVPRNAKSRMSVVICQHGFSGSPVRITGVNLWPWEAARFTARLNSPWPTGLCGARPVRYHSLGSGRGSFSKPRSMPATIEVIRTSLEEKKLHKIVDFLQSLSFVGPGRIGYYGLSYGGMVRFGCRRWNHACDLPRSRSFQ